MADIFPSVAALTDRLGSDAYRIVCIDRSMRRRVQRSANAHTAGQVTIVSPHGGFIEEGTSSIAAAIAGKCFNLFDFQGLRQDRPEELHVTSTNFRHLQLEKLIQKSATVISIHGMHSQGHKSIWLGGLNAELKDLVLQNLRRQGFSVNPNSPRYRGISPSNFVNLACHRGVQLELSNELMSDLFVTAKFSLGKPLCTTDRFSALVEAVQRSIAQWRTCSGGCHCRKSCCKAAADARVS
jgi:phage replication-related protein YjqB (UPF0714/DUF867 family)